MAEKKQWIKVGFTDLDGLFRGKLIHHSKFEKSQDISYCDVIFGWDLHDDVYPEDSVSGWSRGFPDATATVDLSTQRITSWDQTPMYIIDFSEDERFSSVCPRSLLKSAIVELNQLGYKANVGYEYEWFNFKENPETLHNPQSQSITSGMYGYSLTRLAENNNFVRDLLHELMDLGIILEGFHTETGPGVYEAAIKYDTALKSADRAALFKHFVKIIGRRNGIIPTFMAKWNDQLPGCSGHIHVSVVDKDGDSLAFSDPTGNHNGQHFLAGVLNHLDALLPLYNPFVNSYKRLVSGSWAPTKAVWGIENRTAAVRIIPGKNGADRFELRIPGADSNPYLVLYACLMSGIQGLKNRSTLVQQVPVTNAYDYEGLPDLPKNLGAAAENFYHNEEVANWINPVFRKHYYMTRKLEYEKYQRSVTDWEIKRYLEII